MKSITYWCRHVFQPKPFTQSHDKLNIPVNVLSPKKRSSWWTFMLLLLLRVFIYFNFKTFLTLFPVTLVTFCKLGLQTQFESVSLSQIWSKGKVFLLLFCPEMWPWAGRFLDIMWWRKSPTWALRQKRDPTWPWCMLRCYAMLLIS